MFAPVNIENELQKQKRNSPLTEALSILQQEHQADVEVLDRVKSAYSQKQNFTVTGENVFTREQIRTIAIRYRLRFLDSNLFKGEIPYEAILKIKEMEKKHGVKFTEFKILAPAALFKLEDRNKDPLLFASAGNEHYILIHKWGNDLAWHRRFLAFPLRSIHKFLVTVLLTSLLIALLIPADYPARLFIFLLSNLFFLSTFSHIGYIRLNQNFSEFEWDSKFIN